MTAGEGDPPPPSAEDVPAGLLARREEMRAAGKAGDPPPPRQPRRHPPWWDRLLDGPLATPPKPVEVQPIDVEGLVGTVLDAAERHEHDSIARWSRPISRAEVEIAVQLLKGGATQRKAGEGSGLTWRTVAYVRDCVEAGDLWLDGDGRLGMARRIRVTLDGKLRLPVRKRRS